MIRTLKPILDKKSYSLSIEKKINEFLYFTIFGPLLSALKSDLKINIKEDDILKKALSEYKVEYNDGYFTGSFNAKISLSLRNMGAIFDKFKRAYKLELSKIPVDVKSVILSAKEQVGYATDKLNKILDSIVVDDIDLKDQIEKTFEGLQQQFYGTLPKDLSIPFSVNGFIEEKLKRDYTENLSLNIKGWAEEEIIKLREKVQENSMYGYRASNLVESIEAEYGVSQRKAKFLARQETSLMVSKYRKENYKEAGIEEYVWSTSHDQRVRPRHKELNGHVFNWDNPPIVDDVKQRTGHPGEFFGCRCVAIPVLKKRI